MSRQPKHRNAADPEAVAKDATEHQRAAAREALDWRELVKSEGGRRILAWLLEPLTALSYTPHANDTAFREGQRSVARNIRGKLCQHVPEALVFLAAAEAEACKRAVVSDAAPEPEQPRAVSE